MYIDQIGSNKNVDLKKTDFYIRTIKMHPYKNDLKNLNCNITKQKRKKLATKK